MTEIPYKCPICRQHSKECPHSFTAIEQHMEDQRILELVRNNFGQKEQSCPLEAEEVILLWFRRHPIHADDEWDTQNLIGDLHRAGYKIVKNN